jgi:hypothetical protein
LSAGGENRVIASAARQQLGHTPKCDGQHLTTVLMIRGRERPQLIYEHPAACGPPEAQLCAALTSG